MWIRKGIISKIPWDKYPLYLAGEAEDGLEGINGIRQTAPDILLLDMKLPSMDGLEVLTRIRPMLSRMKVIVISGFDEFHYAREAIKFGVSDYLLKPVDTEELEKAIGHCYLSLVSAVTDRKHRASAELDKRFHAGLFSGSTVAEIAKASEAEDVILTNEGYVLAMLQLHESDGPCDSEEVEHTSTIRDALVTASLGAVYQDRMNDRYYYMIMNRTSRTADSSDTFLRAIIGQLFDQFGIKLSIGVSQPADGSTPLELLHTQAKWALRNATIHGLGRVYTYSASKPELFAALSADIQNKLEQEFTLYLEKADKKKWLRTLSDIFALIRSQGESFSFQFLADLYGKVYTFLLARVYANRLDGKRASNAAELAERLDRCSSLDEIEVWLINEADVWFDHAGAIESLSGEDIVYRVQRYIDEHYNQPVSLKYVAETYHLHPNYFSVLFKNLVGQSFQEYITRVRMEKSGELLRKPFEIQDVAELVGYQDSRYFSQVFKKYYGSSPTDYMKKNE